MAYRGNIVPIMPTKGINTSLGPEMIGDDYVVSAQNYRFRDGDWTQRKGYALYDDDAVAASTAITGMFQALFSGGTTSFLVCTGTDIYKLSSGTWTSVKGALTLDGNATYLNSFCVLNDLIIGVNGKNQIWKYNAATDPAVAVSGTPPSTAIALLSFYNRVLALSANGTLYWSTINNPDDWTSAYAGSAAPGLKTGQYGIALGSVGEDAFIFMSGSIWRVNYTGDSKAPFVFRIHDTATGCCGRQTVATVPDRGLLFFANYQGIYTMQAPGFTPVRISQPLDGVGGIWESINKTKLSQISAITNPAKNEVWFSCTLTSGTTNSIVLVYDYDRQTWTTFTGINASTLANFQDGNGDIRVFHGDHSGYIYDNDSGTSDNGTLIDAYVTSKAYPLVDGFNGARVTFVRLFHDLQSSQGDFEFGYGYDLSGITNTKMIPQGIGGALWDTAIWDSAMWATTAQVCTDRNLSGGGHHFQFQLRSRTLNILSRVYKIILGVKPIGRKK